MPRKKRESEIVQSLLFDAGTDLKPQPATYHSDVAETREEKLPGDVEQGSLFQTDVTSARRAVHHVASEPLNTADLTQTDFFQGTGTELIEKEIRIEGCQVITPPEVKTTEKKDVIGTIVRRKTWACTFVAPPDLWTQERDEWISASTDIKTTISTLNKLHLASSDMCTVIGIYTGERDDPMAKGEKQRHVTYVRVSEIIPGIRGTSGKANVVPPKVRRR